MEQSRPAWLEDTYDVYGGASYSLAARILGIGADAEDSVVEAFRELVRLQRLHDHTDLRALSLLITRNASVKKLRQRHGRPVHDAAIMHAGSAASLSQALRTADDLEACAALAGLDPTRRLVLDRFFFEGQTPVEIAAAIGATEAEVTSALAGAMRALAPRGPSRQPREEPTLPRRRVRAARPEEASQS